MVKKGIFKIRLLSYIFIGLLLSLNITSLSAFAVDVDFYSSNDIVFYNPDDACSTASGSNGSGGGGSMPYELPATSGKAGFEEAIDSNGRIPNGDSVTFPKHAALGEEYQKYYITMRWRYVKGWNWNGTAAKPVDNKQMNWFKDAPRIVLVTNKRTGKSINAVALEAGPGPWTGVDRQSNNNPKQGWVNPQDGTPSTYTGRVAGFPPTAVDALEMKQGMYNGTGDILTYQWAPDQSVKPGPTGQGTSGGNCSSAAGEHGWDLNGEHAMVFYDQCASPWNSKNFGSGNLCKCGCGPTSLAMIVATLTGDKSVNPENMADFYASHGGQADGCGSAWNWDVVSTKYSVTVTDIGKDLNKAKETLDNGGLVLFSWEGAPFTGGGHIMVLRKYSTDGKLYIASSGGQINQKQSEEAWDQSIFENGFSGTKDGRSGRGYLKGMWSFMKK